MSYRVSFEEIMYEEVNEYDHEITSCCADAGKTKSFKEVSRQILSPQKVNLVCKYPLGYGHSIRVMEPSVIFGGLKDGMYMLK